VRSGVPRDGFANLVSAGDRCDLARGALEIARIAYPDLDPTPPLRTLDGFADAIRPRLGTPRRPHEAVAEVAAFLFRECGFRGNTTDYYDPRNSFLNDVLERRTGIPISLSVLLMEVSARVGLTVEGVGFPGHFLVRVGGNEGPLFLDPFFAGRIIGRDELLERLRAYYDAGGGSVGADPQRVLPQLLQTTGPVGILARMLANLLRIYLDRGDHAHALAAVDLLLVAQPESAEHFRVRGLLYERLECFGAARQDLERYLTLAPDSAHGTDVRQHLARVIASVH
jgi:regulator of sirC expression with transglutaminase-like and TPR domain